MLPRCGALLMLLICLHPLSQPAVAQQPPDPVRIAQAQNATIGLIAGGPDSTDARVAADMAQILNDSDKLRVLPILGEDSIQNIADLIYLKGVDVAIVHTDVLISTMQRGMIPREASLQYIAKLFQEEIHILARRDIAGLNDLAGKPVAIGKPGSGTELTASALLDYCHIKATLLRTPQSIALARLRRGDIAALFVIGGKPVPGLQEIDAESGLHFLPIPLTAQLVDAYLPTTLDHQHYPNLVPPATSIDTVAVGSVLVTLAASSDTLRAKRVNRFVDTLFERFDQFRMPWVHPKWQEVNLSAQIQGWTRYPEAANLIRAPAEANLRSSFDSYLNQSGQAATGMSTDRRESLFRDFLRWRDQRTGP